MPQAQMRLFIEHKYSEFVTYFAIICYNAVLVVFNQHLTVLAEEQTWPNFDCNGPEIEILISPMNSRNKIREIELIWNVADPKEGDWVGLYDTDPTRNTEAQPLFQSYANELSWVRTNVQEDRDFKTLPLHSSTCMGYWAAYWRRKHDRNSMITSSCLRTNPTWMDDMSSKIKNVKLKDLFIPGTHNSAAYIVSYYPFPETLYQKYVYCQDEPILNQMALGVRYLDIRVGIQKGSYWTNHGPAALQPLSEVLTHIKHFLNQTNEIIVLDFHGFPEGFENENDHTKFVDYLIKELKYYMAENYLSWDTRLRDVWMNRKRLIVAYNHQQIVSKYRRYLWPPISHKWADAQSLDSLNKYLRQFMNEQKPNYMWAAMAEMTPNTFSFLKYRKGLREMADVTNKEVTKWFQGEWGRYCNIVAVDFLRSTGIVPAAIKWNKCRGIK